MSDLAQVQKLEAEIFTPALQEAVRQARQGGFAKDDTLYAAANAYMNMLVPFLGDRATAANFLQQQLDYLRSQVQPQ